MDKSTSDVTKQYVKEHPHIANCLKKGLINYSALARHIATELNIQNKTSKDAILIAARRYKEKISGTDNEIKKLIEESEIEIKNKITVYILDKSYDNDEISDLRESIKEDKGTWYLIEGSDKDTLITQEKYESVRNHLQEFIEKVKSDLALIIYKSPESIEETPGVVSYLTGRFAENGVNIVEMMSCWKDTLFIIESEEVPKAMEFLGF